LATWALLQTRFASERKISRWRGKEIVSLKRQVEMVSAEELVLGWHVYRKCVEMIVNMRNRRRFLFLSLSVLIFSRKGENDKNNAKKGEK
jgi:hypothetical protein